jgi:hypothetical protein
MPTDTTTMDTGLSFGSFIPSIILTVLIIAGMWAAFSKAGQPGWAAIIPFYNIYVWLKVAGRPGWWLILMLIPIVNFIIGIIVSIDFAKAFGKGGAFGFFMLFILGFIGYPLLGFGSAQYQGSPALAGQQAAYRG